MVGYKWLVERIIECRMQHVQAVRSPETCEILSQRTAEETNYNVLPTRIPRSAAPTKKKSQDGL